MDDELLLRVNEENEASISSNSSKTFNKSQKKCNQIFMTILGLAESLKTMNRSDRAWPGPTVTLFDDLFLRKYIR